jgi:hypothetical protein
MLHGKVITSAYPMPASTIFQFLLFDDPDFNGQNATS